MELCLNINLVVKNIYSVQLAFLGDKFKKVPQNQFIVLKRILAKYLWKKVTILV